MNTAARFEGCSFGRSSHTCRSERASPNIGDASWSQFPPRNAVTPTLTARRRAAGKVPMHRTGCRRHRGKSQRPEPHPPKQCRTCRNACVCGVRKSDPQPSTLLDTPYFPPKEHFQHVWTGVERARRCRSLAKRLQVMLRHSENLNLRHV